MKTFKLKELTKEIVDKYFEQEKTSMEIITNSGTRYHIIKSKKGYHCYSNFCWSPRQLTKEMKKVFY